MSDLKQAAEKAIEALESMCRHFSISRLGESSLDDSNERVAAHGAAAALRAALAAEPSREPVATPMTAERAAYFMRRFQHEEKLLGPTEQEALRFVLAMLEPDAAPAAPVVPDGDTQARIAGLEASIAHLSRLVDEQRTLLVDVNEVCGRDGHGGELEDGESEVIDKVRAHLDMLAPTPSQTGEQR